MTLPKPLFPRDAVRAAGLPLTALLLPACSPHEGPRPPVQYRQSTALLVERSAQPDALAASARLVDALQAQGFTVQRLKWPKLATVQDQLAQLARDAQPDDRLLVVIRAPGITQLSRHGQPAPALGMADTPAGPAIREEGELTALTLDALDTWARTQPARHVALVLDACFNGSPFLGQGDRPERPLGQVREPVLHYLVAGDAPLCDAPPHAFIDALSAALRSRASDLDGDGWISASELGVVVQRRVVERSGGRLTPRSGRSLERGRALGEMLFSRPPAPKGQADSGARP